MARCHNQKQPRRPLDLGQSVAPLRTTGTAYVDAILLTTDCRAFGYLSTKCPMSLSAVGKLARQSVTDTHALAYGQTVLTSVGAPKLYCVVEPRRQQSENKAYLTHLATCCLLTTQREGPEQALLL